MKAVDVPPHPALLINERSQMEKSDQRIAALAWLLPRLWRAAATFTAGMRRGGLGILGAALAWIAGPLDVADVAPLPHEMNEWIIFWTRRSLWIL